MHNHHNRVVLMKKQDLINKIQENKKNHEKDYLEAVEAYKKEAQKQLNQQQTALDNGNIQLRLNLVTPINCAADYDKVLEMFKWEIKDEVELTQKKFNEYIHDETSFAVATKFSNSTYK